MLTIQNWKDPLKYFFSFRTASLGGRVLKWLLKLWKNSHCGRAFWLVVCHSGEIVSSCAARYMLQETTGYRTEHSKDALRFPITTGITSPHSIDSSSESWSELGSPYWCKARRLSIGEPPMTAASARHFGNECLCPNMPQRVTWRRVPDPEGRKPDPKRAPHQHFLPWGPCAGRRETRFHTELATFKDFLLAARNR